MPGAALLPLGQTNHRRPVVALDQHEGQIEAGRQHRGDQKHRQIPQPDTRRHRQEAQQHDRLMHQLGLAHRLGDLVPCVQRRVEQRRFIGGHVVLPSPHPQQFVQFQLKAALTEPGMLHVRAVAHAAVVAPAHQQPHDKMIGDRAAGDPHRQEQPPLKPRIQRQHDRRQQQADSGDPFHHPRHQNTSFTSGTGSFRSILAHPPGIVHPLFTGGQTAAARAIMPVYRKKAKP